MIPRLDPIKTIENASMPGESLITQLRKTRKQPTTTAMLNQEFAKLNLDGKTQDLMDLLESSSYVPMEVIDHLKKEYQKEYTIKQAKAFALASVATSLPSNLATPMKQEIAKSDAKVAPNFYQHLLRTFQKQITRQLELNVHGEHQSESSAHTINGVHIMSFICESPIPAIQLQRYARYQCELDSKKAGELLASYASSRSYSKEDEKSKKENEDILLAFIENGADVDRYYLIPDLISHDRIVPLAAIMQRDQKNIAVEKVEHGLERALSDGKYQAADLLLTRPDLRIKREMLKHCSLTRHSAIDEAKIIFLLRHGVKPLDIATGLSNFSEFVNTIADRKNLEQDYAKPIAILQKLADSERNYSSQEFVQAMFEDLSPHTNDFISDLKAHPIANLHDRLATLNNNSASLPAEIKRDIELRVQVTKGVLKLYNLPEEIALRERRRLEHERHRLEAESAASQAATTVNVEPVKEEGAITRVGRWISHMIS